jgi:hypothetical protein
MLALVKRPHIELSLHGERAEELLAWIKERYEVAGRGSTSCRNSGTC